MKQALIMVIVIFGFAAPALASHCPKDAAKIQQSLASNSNAEAKALMDQGMALHKEGKHKESVEALHQAMDLLGIAHE